MTQSQHRRNLCGVPGANQNLGPDLARELIVGTRAQRLARDDSPVAHDRTQIRNELLVRHVSSACRSGHHHLPPACALRAASVLFTCSVIRMAVSNAMSPASPD